MANETATHWEHAAFADFKPGDRIRFVTNDNGYGGLGIYWRTGTVTKVTVKTITVSCDRNLLGDRAVIRLADWSYREPQKEVALTADGSRFCLACGATFDTTALLDAHQEKTGHERNIPEAAPATANNDAVSLRPHVERGQVYRSCSPRGPRIRVVAVNPNGVDVVDADTGNWPVRYAATFFHSAPLDRDGRSPRFGYVLESH